MLHINIEQFSYPNASEILILEDIAFSLHPGDHLAVLGESGCGKSTLLHLVYGLLHLEHGNLSWKNKALLGPQHNLVPGELFMKLVAQEFNVMPYISVAENIATHLSRNDATKDAARVTELLAVVDLAAYKDTKVKNLSGGQKQRVALAKALANTPEVILLDEPFSNIDTFRKNKLRRNLYGYLKAHKITCITATHDSDEALGFADSILMLRHGKKEAMGAPQEIISNLSTPYQAGFFGSVSQLENKTLLPHQLYISETKTPYSGRISNSYFKGHFYELEITTDTGILYVQHHTKISKDSEVFVAFRE